MEAGPAVLLASRLRAPAAWRLRPSVPASCAKYLDAWSFLDTTGVPILALTRSANKER